MDDPQAFSLSVDDKKEHCPKQFDEVWSDLANPCGKEFELPSVTSPLSTSGSENNNLASPFELLDPPAVIDETFLDKMIDPSFGGNLGDTLPFLETAPLLCHTISMDAKQKGVSEGFKDINVPIAKIDAFRKSQELDVGDSLNPPLSLSSIASLNPETNPTNGHSSSDDFVFRSGILQPVQYQSQDILVAPYSTWLGSNGSISENHAYYSKSSNGVAHVPLMANTIGFTAITHKYDSPQYLNCCLYPTGTPANISISTNSERVTQTRAPLSYFFGSEEFGQSFNLDSFPLGLSSSYVCGENGAPKYPGYDGGREFGGYGTFGGPMSSYSGPQMSSLNLSIKLADPDPITRLELGHPLVAVEKKTEESNVSNKVKGKISSGNEHEREKMPCYNPKAKIGRGGFQPSKRPKQGAHQQYNSAVNPISSVFDSLSKETRSATAVQKAFREAREALDNYPS